MDIESNHTGQRPRNMYLPPARTKRKPTLRRLLYRAGMVLGMLWALPLTLLGVLVALPIVISGGRTYIVWNPIPAILIRGRVADYLLQRHPFGAMSAMAIGHIVIAANHGLTRQTITHELAHVQQAARWGMLFPFVYVASSVWAALHGQDAYWNNVFEIAARKAEKRS
jgi:hypothetical protein